MSKISKWLIFTALILEKLYRHGCTNVFGGQDYLDPEANVIELSDIAKAEIEACIWQYKEGYQYNADVVMDRCIEAYNGLRNPPGIFANLPETNFGKVKPPTGFRIRHEIRTLSDKQRAEVFHVFQELYKRGIARHFGLVHTYGEMRAHQGAAFLLWHRIFITHWEEEMRKINPNVALPYWDYSIDAELEKPEDSIVWTDCFFGNGYGNVTTGPFGNEIGRYGVPVKRKLNEFGKEVPLISKTNIQTVLNGTCHFEEITTGRKKTVHNLEPFHGSVHAWIGGDFNNVPEAAFDLIFFMHHAFIDLIYQKFRNQQMNKTLCGDIDIENDYRPLDDLMDKHQHHQGPDDPVPGYGHLLNKHGLWKNWTTEFYNYAPQPSCPDNCGGKYLYCDSRGKCMTRTKYDEIPCTPFQPVFPAFEKLKNAGNSKSKVQNTQKIIAPDNL